MLLQAYIGGLQRSAHPTTVPGNDVVTGGYDSLPHLFVYD